MTEKKKTIEDLHTSLQKISALVCEARVLAEELESDVSDPREWLIEEWELEDLQMKLTEWRDSLETVEGEMDDTLPQKTE